MPISSVGVDRIGQADRIAGGEAAKRHDTVTAASRRR